MMETHFTKKKFIHIVFILTLSILLAGISILDLRAVPKKQIIRVAMCQIFALDGDRSGNFTRIENATQEAKQADADIACFPENALLGWVNPEAHKRGNPIPGGDSDRLCRLAEKYQIHICVGLAEKAGNHLYDSVILIDDKGKILLKHRKINILSSLMTPPYTPGKDIQCVDTRLGRIGLLICADTFKDKTLQKMASLQPDMVLVPYGWAAKEEQWPEHGQELKETVSKAAATIGAPVVGVDLVGMITHGPWTGMVYGGQSVAADAEGKILAVARDRDREVKLLDIKIQKK